MDRVAQRVSEQAVVIGKHRSLVGIVARGVSSASQATLPVVVILNTGIIHRVGHHRMYVSLSRVLARLGYTVVRFDLSGIGDSESRAEALPPWESVFADIEEVADWVGSTLGVRRIILIGLCSGADQAIFYGSSDPRVVGLVLMDPTIPATPRYHLHYYGRRMLRFHSWRRAARRLSNKLGSFKKPEKSGVWSIRDLKAMIAGEQEGRDFLEGLYQRSVDKGTQMLTILAAGQDTRHSYREQLLDAFPTIRFAGLLRLEFLEDCDHTFSYEADRIRLTNLICDWIQQTSFSKSSETLRKHSAVAFLLFCLPSISSSLNWCANCSI